MPTIYLISGCNGAGKSTVSYTVLPEILDCKEYVNADNIAAGTSPFQPETVSLEAGRIMLERINQLAASKVDFAIETTLSSRNYLSKLKEWQDKGYQIVLAFFWLNSPNLAIQRIIERVKKGGHSIPDEIVIRRYYRGIKNLFEYFISVCDYWVILDNSDEHPQVISEGIKDLELDIFNEEIWAAIKKVYYDQQN